MIKIAFLAALLSVASVATLKTEAVAHGGGLDANRCHTDHSTGVYHCH
jgi:hypothetical protein